MKPDYTGHTPIERTPGDIWLKRDDKFTIAGTSGGKVRACWYLAHVPPAPAGLITASARKSPQAQIVARLAARLGIPARLHMPQGMASAEMLDVRMHNGNIVQHRAGYNNVICSRAIQDSKDNPAWRYIPFGMESKDAMRCTIEEAVHTFNEWEHELPKRIVLSVGSGMTMAALLWAQIDPDLQNGHWADVPILGIRVGADPTRRLDKYAPTWRFRGASVVASAAKYTDEIEGEIETENDEIIELDPHYESRCSPYLKPGDLFWITGIRTNDAKPTAEK